MLIYFLEVIDKNGSEISTTSKKSKDKSKRGDLHECDLGK